MNSSLADAVLRAKRLAKKEWIAQERKKREERSILESDAAFEKFKYKNRGCLGYQPMVRASVYSKVDPRQEIRGYYWVGQQDPRRPVIQRGCLEAMYQKHSRSYFGNCANGYVEKVLLRFLRRIKYTSFDGQGDVVSRAMRKLREKHYTTYHAFRSGYGSFWYGSAGEWRGYSSDRRDWFIWLNGRLRQGLTEHQVGYIKKLYEVVQATKSAEDQVAGLGTKKAA